MSLIFVATCICFFNFKQLLRDINIAFGSAKKNRAPVNGGPVWIEIHTNLNSTIPELKKGD